jgi:hypothetical protein
VFINSTGCVARPGSHHAKFLPLIRETAAEAEPGKIWKKYRQCVEGIYVPTTRDVRSTHHCSFRAARKKGLFSDLAIQLVADLACGCQNQSVLMAGADGFFYELGTGKVRALHVGDLRITEAHWNLLRLFEGMRGFQAAEKLIAAIFSEETPTFELADVMRLAGGAICFGDLGALLPDGRSDAWDEMSLALEAVLLQRGYRPVPSISTLQEYKLNCGAALPAHPAQPYMPLGLVNHGADGSLGAASQQLELGPEEAGLARELCVFTGAYGKHYGSSANGGTLHIFLEPLDGDGNTIRDPRPIDTAHLGRRLTQFPLEEAIEKCCLINGVVKSGDFPYKRD